MSASDDLARLKNKITDSTGVMGIWGKTQAEWDAIKEAKLANEKANNAGYLKQLEDAETARKQNAKKAFDSDPENNTVDLRDLALEWESLSSSTDLEIIDTYIARLVGDEGAQVKYRSYSTGYGILPKDGSEDGWYVFNIYDTGDDCETYSMESDCFKNLKEALIYAENHIADGYDLVVAECSEIIKRIRSFYS